MIDFMRRKHLFNRQTYILANVFILLGVVIGSMTLNNLIVQASTAVQFGYRDNAYTSPLAGNDEPTGEKPESKLWWNDGYWWGSIWNDTVKAYHIYRLDISTQIWVDTGVELDNRQASRADALWDGQYLYIASHIFANTGAPTAASSRGRLYRYHYDATNHTYITDSGFPVQITGGKSETLVIEKDSSGQLWVTYVESKTVMVNHSLNGDDRTWGTPFALPVSAASVDSDDISSIIAYNQHIGIMWSNQISSKTMYYSVHPVGAADTVWTQARVFVISGDDHINLKSLETDTSGNVFAVVKTADRSHQIVLLVCKNNLNRCKSESDWTSYIVYDSTVTPTRAILLLDMTNRQLYIFSQNKDSAGVMGIYYKRTSLDKIEFTPSSIGQEFIRSESDTNINNPTSTKQNLNSVTGLVVLASNSSSHYYFHNYMDLSSSPTPSMTPTATNTSTPTQNSNPAVRQFDKRYHI